MEREKEYREHVGATQFWDIASALQFNLLTTLGLREDHNLLDIGCGSLRAGRLFIPYLKPEKYHGLEPLKWLVDEGIKNELGESILQIKRPTFIYDKNFAISKFGKQFDFIIAQSIFSHTSQAQMRTCFSETRKVMRPSSIFAATFFEGDRNYKGNRWSTHAEYTMDKMKELVEESGLICQSIEWAHQDMQRWILILHPENTIQIPERGDPIRILHLEQQLKLTQQHLQRIRMHPYVKLGHKIRWFLIWLRFLKEFLARALRRKVDGRNDLDGHNQ